MICPTELMIAFPEASDPPPPMNLTEGGPQARAPTLQVFSKISEKSRSKSKLFGSIELENDLILLNISEKSVTAKSDSGPSHRLHS